MTHVPEMVENALFNWFGISRYGNSSLLHCETHADQRAFSSGYPQGSVSALQ